MALYLGLMSGTSLDGADGVLVDLADPITVLAHAHRPYADHWRAELLALNQAGPDELHRAALAANAVARFYADLVEDLLGQSGQRAAAITAIGAHGQTVRHRPGEFDDCGYTLQLLNGALLAELTGIDTVCDLRNRDVAAGGQGAPLVPAFHQAIFGRDDAGIAVLNLGGIANLTLLPANGGPVSGFDCGPGNVLMDHWTRQHRGAAFDDNGQWAAQGQVSKRLLETLCADPYFARQPPKSTGRDLFNPGWLGERLEACGAGAELAVQDVQATLLEFTVRTVVDDLRRHAPATDTLIVCGGGARNGALRGRLGAALSPIRVQRSEEAAGLAAEQIEAMAFAWLAQRFVERRGGNLGAVTGARGRRVLGAFYPGPAPG